MYNIGIKIKFKTSMIRSSLRDYSDAYILVKGIITVSNTGTTAAPKNRNRKVIFKNCAAFADFINKINNKEIDPARDIGVVIPIYNFIEYSDNYLKTSRDLWQYYREEPFVDNDGVVIVIVYRCYRC